MKRLFTTAFAKVTFTGLVKAFIQLFLIFGLIYGIMCLGLATSASIQARPAEQDLGRYANSCREKNYSYLGTVPKGKDEVFIQCENNNKDKEVFVALK